MVQADSDVDTQDHPLSLKGWGWVTAGAMFRFESKQMLYVCKLRGPGIQLQMKQGSSVDAQEIHGRPHVVLHVLGIFSNGRCSSASSELLCMHAEGGKGKADRIIERRQRQGVRAETLEIVDKDVAGRKRSSK